MAAGIGFRCSSWSTRLSNSGSYSVSAAATGGRQVLASTSHLFQCEKWLQQHGCVHAARAALQNQCE